MNQLSVIKIAKGLCLFYWANWTNWVYHSIQLNYLKKELCKNINPFNSLFPVNWIIVYNV